MWLRVVLNILMLGSVLFLSWWVTAVIAVGFLFKFRAYEIILWGVVADILYSSSVVDFYNIQFAFTLGAVGVFVISYFIKKRLMYYGS